MDCGRGLVNPEEGGSTPSDNRSCEVGKASNGTASATCTDFPSGSYADKQTPATTVCSQCGGDAYNPEVGSSAASACLDCPAGLTGLGAKCVTPEFIFHNLFTESVGGISRYSKDKHGFVETIETIETIVDAEQQLKFVHDPASLKIQALDFFGNQVASITTPAQVSGMAFSRRMHEEVMNEMISRRENEEALAAKGRELDELRRGS